MVHKLKDSGFSLLGVRKCADPLAGCFANDLARRKNNIRLCKRNMKLPDYNIFDSTYGDGNIQFF